MPIQTVGNFLGCLQSPDKTISYHVSCINASALNVNYFSGGDCAGSAIETTPVGWAAGCAGTSDGKATFTAVCTPGDYTPPTQAVNTYLYAEKECPLVDPFSYTGVVSLPFQCNKIPSPNSPFASSYIYSCDKKNITATIFSTLDCSGNAVQTVPVGPLGCVASDTASVTFTVCGTTPPPPTKSLRAEKGTPVVAATAVSDEVTATIAAGLARAQAATAAASQQTTAAFATRL